MDRLLPLYGPTPEGAGPVVQAPGHTDAHAVEGAAAFPADHSLQVVNALDHRDRSLGLHQVEGDMAAHLLSLGDDAPGHFPYHRGLHGAGLDAVPVQVLLSQGEVVSILGQGVLLVQGE